MTDLVPVSPTTITALPDEGEEMTLFYPAIALPDAKFLAAWLNRKPQKTIVAYSSDMIRMYTHIQKSLRSLELEDIQSYIGTLRTFKPSSQARMIASLKSALTFATAMRYIDYNVGVLIKLPKLENTLSERILSEEEILRIFAAENNPRNHAILVLLYRSGIRAEEICDLQWRHCVARDQGRGQLAIHGKGKKTRFIVLDSRTWQELMDYKGPEVGPDDSVFQSRKCTNGKRRLDESQIHRIVKSAAARAGVALCRSEETEEISSKASPHWFRHSHATHALENKASLPLVGETLGHDSLQTTTKYIHVRPDESSSLYLRV